MGSIVQRLLEERRTAVSRCRQPPGVRHARVRPDRRRGHPRQGRGADHRRVGGHRPATAQRGGDPGRAVRVQEQHRLGGQFLRLPRELPDSPRRGPRGLLEGPDPVPGVSSDLRRCRKDPPDRLRTSVLPEPASRAHLGGGLLGHHEEPPDHQHARRASCRCRALPAAPCDRRRFEHERVRVVPQGRRHRRAASDARGQGADLEGPHARQPHQSHSRDLTGHRYDDHGSTGQRP